MSLKLVLEEVEQLREQLHVMVADKGILHPEVLMLSKKLDCKLNEYWELRQNLKTKKAHV